MLGLTRKAFRWTRSSWGDRPFVQQIGCKWSSPNVSWPVRKSNITSKSQLLKVYSKTKLKPYVFLRRSFNELPKTPTAIETLFFSGLNCQLYLMTIQVQWYDIRQVSLNGMKGFSDYNNWMKTLSELPFSLIEARFRKRDLLKLLYLNWLQSPIDKHYPWSPLSGAQCIIEKFKWHLFEELLQLINLRVPIYQKFLLWCNIIENFKWEISPVWRAVTTYKSWSMYQKFLLWCNIIENFKWLRAFTCLKSALWTPLKLASISYGMTA